jgi:hypothetical protein
MNKKQFIFLSFALYGFMQQNILSSYTPVALSHTDKTECKALRKEILNILQQERQRFKPGLSEDKYRYLMVNVAAFKMLKCNLSENTF